MITNKEAELHVLTELLEFIDDSYARYGEDRYAKKYSKALSKYHKVLNKRYMTISDKLAPVAGEA